MRLLVVCLLLLLTCSACDGLDSFDRSNPRDPKSSKFAPNVADVISFGTRQGYITIEWGDRSRLEDGFLVERKIGEDPFQKIARVEASHTSTTDTVTSHGRYTYRVCSLYEGEKADCETGELDLSHFLPLPDISNIHGERWGGWIPVSLDTSSIMVFWADGKSKIFDFQSWRWRSAPSLPYGSHIQTATRLEDGRVLVVGKDKENCKVGFGALFDPVAEEWGSIECIKTEGEGSDIAVRDAVPLEGGGALVVGESEVGYLEWKAFANVFDADGTRFYSIPSPKDPRSLTKLPNRGVLSVGGTSAIFDPTTETWSSVNIPLNAFNNYTGVLPDGRLLVVGTDIDEFYRSSLIYYPSSDDYTFKQKSPPTPYFGAVVSPSNTNRILAGFGLHVYTGNNRCHEGEILYPYFVDPKTNKWIKGNSVGICYNPISFMRNRAPFGDGNVLLTGKNRAAIVRGRKSE